MAKNDVKVETEIPEEAAPEISVVKSKKELKKERKEIKKHKKEVKKEARRHSAKTTKAQNFFLSVISILVIVAMLVCTYSAVKITTNLNSAPAASNGTSNETPNSGTPSTPSNPTNSSNTPASSTPSNDSPNTDAPANETPAGDSPNTDAPADNNNVVSSVANLSTKEEIVDYYKAAYAKVMSSAKKVTRTYDNTTNYNGVVEVNNNDRLASLAQTLMNQFMKENTDREEHTSDIADVFPAHGNTANLTADMISEATVKEEGNNYIITLKIDSTEENPDLGDKTKNLASIVETSQITDAVAGMISFDGLENRYIGATAVATIDKATGNLIALETDAPSYMCFGQVTAFVIVKVSNCRLGLEYQQKWEVEY